MSIEHAPDYDPSDYDPNDECCGHGILGGEGADPPCRECVAEDRGDDYAQWDREDFDGV